MKKGLFLFAVLLMVSLALFSCKKKEAAAPGGESAGTASQSSSQTSGGYLRFAWWGNTVRDERTVKVAQLFMEKNPGVTVETEPTAWDGYWTKLNTQAASGALPDLMQQDYAYINQWFNRNLLEDLNPYTQSKVIDLSKWADSAVASGRINGKLIALNLGTNAWGMGVDPAVLQKAGVTIDDVNWTWKEFEQIALTIFQKTGVQTHPFSAHKQLVEFWARELGYSYYSADGKTMGWSSIPGEIKEWLDINLRLKAAGALYNPEESFLQVTMEEEPFSRGKTWNAYYWSNQHVGHINAAKRNVIYIMHPNNPNLARPYKKFGTYLKPSQFISMLSTSPSKDLAAKFVNFFVNDLEANSILLAERGIPVPTDVRDHLAPKVDPQMKTLFDYIGKVTPYTSPIDPPDPARAGEAEDAMRKVVLQCLLGQFSSTQAAEEMLKAAHEILAR
ncbi:MAG: ABC transporter substrate-binding protein [Treponema sp.]|jgi:multiple sugar transport system substrate-binding protein|nr:ABC transporter substrate-binding protein [Treponema sp.]